MKTSKKIWQLLKPFHQQLFILIFLILLFEASLLAWPIILGQIYEKLAIKDESSINNLIGLIFILSLTELLLNYLKDVYRIKKISFDSASNLAQKASENFFKLSIGQHSNRHVGTKKSILDKGLQGINRLIDSFIYQIFPVIFNIILIIIGIAILNLIAGLISLLVCITYSFFIIKYSKKFKPLFTAQADLWHKSNKIREENFSEVTLIKINNQEKKCLDNYKNSRDNFTTRAKKTWHKIIGFQFISKSINEIIYGLVIIIGAKLVLANVTSVTVLITVSSWLVRLLYQIYNFNRSYNEITESYVDAEKLVEFMEIKPDIANIENPKIIKNLKGNIKFSNVCFSYQRKHIDEDGEEKLTDEIVLKNINFEIEAGSKTAFVGATGSGKSTIVQMLLRFYDPHSGSISIDNYDLRIIDSNYYYPQVGYVEQNIALFDTTIRDNIKFGLNRPETVGDSDILKVLEIVQLGDFLSTLENGLDTVIGERGAQLSGGQRQRLAIARALIKNPRILILDEATSALDTITEGKIQKAIDASDSKRTTIIVAHRLSTIRNADKIFVVKKGEIIASGTYHELLQNSKDFQELIRHQIEEIVLFDDLKEILN